MFRHIALVAFILLCVSAVSAIGIIGAIDDDATAYEEYVLNNALESAEAFYGEGIVSTIVKPLSEVTDEDLEQNVVLIAKDGRVLISVPEGSQAQGYYDTVEPYVGEFLPTYDRPADEVIEDGIDDSFDEGCVETDSGIYESGIASGKRAGSSVVASYEDLCIVTTLVEYSCEDDIVVREEVACENGCSDGACIDYEEQARSSGGGDGSNCPTRWLWTRNGYVCETPGVPVDVQETVIEAPETCSGCVSGERCMVFGDRLPDGTTCTGAGITCLGCADGSECLSDGELASDNRTCEGGVLVSEAEDPDEPNPAAAKPAESVENPPAPEPEEPEEPERRGLFSWFGDFFARIFGRS